MRHYPECDINPNVGHNKNNPIHSNTYMVRGPVPPPPPSVTCWYSPPPTHTHGDELTASGVRAAQTGYGGGGFNLSLSRVRGEGKGILIWGSEIKSQGGGKPQSRLSEGGGVSISSIMGLGVWIKGWGGLIGKPSCLSEIEIQVRRFLNFHYFCYWKAMVLSQQYFGFWYCLFINFCLTSCKF